jgi:sporulation-control protein
MLFRSLRRALGVGGPAVDTVLDDPETRPGESLTGAVHLTGGGHDVEIERIVVTLVTRVGTRAVELQRHEVAGGFPLAAGAQLRVPLGLVVALQTPITHVYGERVPGLAVGLRTDLEVAYAVDKGDLDHVAVRPLPAEEAALEALRALGFRFKSADVSPRPARPPAQLFEFWTAPQYQDRATEVRAGFVTGPDTVELVLDGRLRTRHARGAGVDWQAEIDRLMRQIGQI